jgi:hypothetical protein
VIKIAGAIFLAAFAIPPFIPRWSGDDQTANDSQREFLTTVFPIRLGKPDPQRRALLSASLSRTRAQVVRLTEG